MDFIKFKNRSYPAYQSYGFSAQFAIPYAKYFCKGTGYDIGCGKKEWAFPGSIPIDFSLDDGYDAMKLPLQEKVDYIFSSHCLEHLDDWVEALNYWYEVLKDEGILFLYLPHYDQEYWRPWNNRKHRHIFTPEIIRGWMSHKNFKYILDSGKDLNDSFMVVGEK